MPMEFLEGNLKDFHDKADMEAKGWAEWEKERSFGKCEKCGAVYSYGYETGYQDPGECASCRGALGELVY